MKFLGTNKFPAARYSIVGNYSTQKAPLQENRIQPILVGKYFGTMLRCFNQWNAAKEFKMGPQTLKYLLNMIRSGIEKYGVFLLSLLSANV